MTKYQKSNTYTLADVGVIPVADTGDEYTYYEAVIKYAYDKFGFQVDRDDDLYLDFMLDQPFIYFEGADNPDLYTDFVQAWDFLNLQCDDNVRLRFNNGILQFVKEE